MRAAPERIRTLTDDLRLPVEADTIAVAAAPEPGVGSRDTLRVIAMPGFPCPCCGHRTLLVPSPSWLTCGVCFWSDDRVRLAMS